MLFGATPPRSSANAIQNVSKRTRIATGRLRRNQRRADRAHHTVVARHDQVIVAEFQQSPERGHQSVVACHTALKRDGNGQFPSPHQVRQIRAHQRFVQSGHDVRQRTSFLLVVRHVGLSEDGAAAGDADRRRGLESQSCKLVQRKPEPRGLLVKKCARTRRAHFVHGEVCDSAFLAAIGGAEDDELRILAADFDDAVHFRVQQRDGAGVRRDFVHLARVQKGGNQ